MTQTGSGSVVIVGGGVVGLSCGWYLQRMGWTVTLMDRGVIGGACSFGNCGLVCPSHVLPLTEPGAFQTAIRSVLTPNSPFRIRPRWDPALWSWLWNFSRRCNHSSMVQAAHAIQALLASAMDEYKHWVEVEQLECEWQAKGLLFAYLSQQALEAYAATDTLLSEHFNEPARRLSAAESVELEPALEESALAGSWFYPHDAHLRPDVLLSSLRKSLLARGAQLLEHCELNRIDGQAGTAMSVKTNQGSYSADAMVLACGAWSPFLRDQVGSAIPIQPGKGYSITMPKPQICPTIPLIFPEHRVAVTPMRSGYRLGSIMEFAGYDESIRPERLELLRRGAEPYLKQPYCEPELSTWYGWRPMTPDSLPIIDHTPRWGNVWLATGHNMLGLSMAPATGKLIAELLSGRSPHIDPTPYGLSRLVQSAGGKAMPSAASA